MDKIRNGDIRKIMLHNKFFYLNTFTQNYFNTFKHFYLKKNDETAMQSSEMKFLKSVKGCSIMNKIKDEDIRKILLHYK